MKRYVALIALTLIGAVAAPPAATALGTDIEPSIDYVLEVNPSEDLDHWIDFALDTADVPRLERDSRVVYKYEEAINGVWLKLTPDEASAIDGIRGHAGIRALTRSFRLNAQWIAEDVVIAGVEGRIPAWPGQQTPAGITRVDGAHNVDYSDVKVGVAGTGTDRFHEDLNVVDGFNCTFEGNPDDWSQDRNGHDTHTAGTIAALDNDRGVVGVAPGASIYAYKVLNDSGSGSYASVLCGVDRAMVDDVDVLSMSLGGGNEQSVCDSWDSFHTAVCNATAAGLIVVVAAGNDTADALASSPANYPEAVTISAVADWDGAPRGQGVEPSACPYPQRDDELAWFSNEGSLVDAIDPGVCVVSTYPGNRYAIASGTSMATPHAAGIFAAYIAQTGVHGQEAVDAVLDYSRGYNAQWTGDVDYDHEPLLILPGS